MFSETRWPTDTNTRRRKRQSRENINFPPTLLQIKSIRFSEKSSSIENNNRRARSKDHWPIDTNTRKQKNYKQKKTGEGNEHPPTILFRVSSKKPLPKFELTSSQSENVDGRSLFLLHDFIWPPFISSFLANCAQEVRATYRPRCDAILSVLRWWQEHAHTPRSKRIAMSEEFVEETFGTPETEGEWQGAELPSGRARAAWGQRRGKSKNPNSKKVKPMHIGKSRI